MAAQRTQANKQHYFDVHFNALNSIGAVLLVPAVNLISAHKSKLCRAKCLLLTRRFCRQTVDTGASTLDNWN